MLNKGKVLVVLLLLGATWQVLQLTSGVRAVPITRDLRDFPVQFDGYRLAGSFQSSAEVLELLGVDNYIQYNYVNDDRERINLYAGYYSAVGVRGSYHSPRNCLPGGGWSIESVERIVLPVGMESNHQSTVSQMIIKNGDEYQVVLYWYQNRGRIIASEYMEKFYLVVDALFKGRRDGAFVRIMTLARDGNVDAARIRARDFAKAALPRLGGFLPGVTP